ncbi:Fur family ferric uptake transcriptional regulator [Saccharothrix coeruleofusca]|uniref:Fur family transcriptional regulator n=1 Tax=Saccharothrix coeruleofusca TaxID=33919 RepID=UPI001AE2534E|nr:transcriptional repressor [Saccharothrix coeruleofusca]MBP2337257.1 Fur family ferric uptake transcriptional regulator [Saccharothrix coeruleofusca]
MDRSNADGVTGLRMTPHRRAVLRALACLPGPAAVHTIHHALRASGERVGLSTLYRQIATLVDAGVIGTRLDRQGRHLFHLRTDDTHDHHLTCVRCGHATPVDASAVLRWAADAAAAHGFSDITTWADLTGLCPRCPAGRATGTRSARTVPEPPEEAER